MLAPTANANVSPRPGDRFVWAKHLVTMVQTGTDSAQPGTLCVGQIAPAGVLRPCKGSTETLATSKDWLPRTNQPPGSTDVPLVRIVVADLLVSAQRVYEAR